MALAGLRPQRGLKDKLSSRPPLYSLKTGNPNDGTIYCENTRILSGPPTRNWTLGCRFSPVCGADLDPAPPVGGAPDCGPPGVLHITHPPLSLGSPPDNKTKIRGQTVPQTRLLTLQSCCLCDNNDANRYLQHYPLRGQPPAAGGSASLVTCPQTQQPAAPGEHPAEHQQQIDQSQDG